MVMRTKSERGENRGEQSGREQGRGKKRIVSTQEKGGVG